MSPRFPVARKNGSPHDYPLDGGYLPPRAREALTRGIAIDGRGTLRPPNIAIIARLVQDGDAAAADGDGRFRVGPYHLGQVAGSSNWYRFRYCAERGYDRKVSLRTRDLDEAKVILAVHYSEENPDVYLEEGDVSVAIAIETYLRDPKHLKSWKGTYGSVLRAIDELFPGITVGAFTGGRQKELITRLRAGFIRGPTEPSTIATYMTLVQSALNEASRPDDDGMRLCRTDPPPILTSPTLIAEYLELPAPLPRNWHPSTERMGEILRLLLNAPHFEKAEAVRRWLLLSLGFACRCSCAREATAEQIDRDFGFYKLNPDGRTQKVRKYRPALPLPPSLLAEMERWPEERYVDLSHNCLYVRFREVGEELGLGGKLIPSCIRDYAAYAMRHAHLDYGIPKVPAEEVEMWMGHQRPGTNKHYGTFGPEFLLLARNAIECLVHDIDGLSGGVLLGNARRAGTLPAGPVVIDPSKTVQRVHFSQFAVRSGVFSEARRDLEKPITAGSLVIDQAPIVAQAQGRRSSARSGLVSLMPRDGMYSMGHPGVHTRERSGIQASAKPDVAHAGCQDMEYHLTLGSMTVDPYPPLGRTQGGHAAAKSDTFFALSWGANYPFGARRPATVPYPLPPRSEFCQVSAKPDVFSVVPRGLDYPVTQTSPALADHSLSREDRESIGASRVKPELFGAVTDVSNQLSAKPRSGRRKGERPAVNLSGLKAGSAAKAILKVLNLADTARMNDEDLKGAAQTSGIAHEAFIAAIAALTEGGVVYWDDHGWMLAEAGDGRASRNVGLPAAMIFPGEKVAWAARMILGSLTSAGGMHLSGEDLRENAKASGISYWAFDAATEALTAGGVLTFRHDRWSLPSTADMAS